MMEYKVTRTAPDELKHFGIKGQKWGVRRYENEDGTLTEAGKKRYAKSEKIASREKISNEQIKKNAIKRAAIGATAGAAIGSIADSISRKNSFLNATTNGTGYKKHADIKKEDNGFDFLSGFTNQDMNKKVVGNFVSGGHLDLLGWHDDYTWYYPDVKFKNNGEAYHYMQRITKSLLSAPAAGAAIGAGATALGSVVVDKLHNTRIDRAKKFVERYTSAYQMTVSSEKARDERIKEYKKEHPNSVLKDKEIEAMLLNRR